MSKWGRKRERPPPGFAMLSPTLTALEREMRAKINESHEGKRKVEMLWPIHQINNQRSRYVYDMFYVHARISRAVYDYCIRQKLVDAELIAKWKKPGYDRLCSTFAINTQNYPYGTVSICRVPRHFLRKGQIVQDSHSGCRGCSSGKGGFHNIFGNKYGQRLADIQVMREKLEKQASCERERASEASAGDAGQSEAVAGSAKYDTQPDYENIASDGGLVRENNGDAQSLPPDVSAKAQAALSAWQQHGRSAFEAHKERSTVRQRDAAQSVPSSKRSRLR